jgi:hypothetical protein
MDDGVVVRAETRPVLLLDDPHLGKAIPHRRHRTIL